MSKKTIEEKFISYQHEITTAFSVNDIVDKHGKEMYLKVHQNQFLSYKAGYETAQKESEERLKEAEECLKFYADKNTWDSHVCDWHSGFVFHFSHDNVNNEVEHVNGEYICGKRARSYFKKWGVE